MIEACEQLPVDLDVVHGVPHEEAVDRFKRADIVVDQMHYIWHGVFAIESMAYGKPVVTSLDETPSARRRRRSASTVPIVSATPETLVERLRPLVESFEERRRLGEAGRAYVEQVHDIDKLADRLIEVYESRQGGTPSADDGCAATPPATNHPLGETVGSGRGGSVGREEGATRTKAEGRKMGPVRRHASTPARGGGGATVPAPPRRSTRDGASRRRKRARRSWGTDAIAPRLGVRTLIRERSVRVRGLRSRPPSRAGQDALEHDRRHSSRSKSLEACAPRRSRAWLRGPRRTTSNTYTHRS